jgi:hypothetical protein
MDPLRSSIRSFLGLADTELEAVPLVDALVEDEMQGDGFLRKSVSYVSDGGVPEEFSILLDADGTTVAKVRQSLASILGDAG